MIGVGSVNYLQLSVQYVRMNILKHCWGRSRTELYNLTEVVESAKGQILLQCKGCVYYFSTFKTK